MSNTVSKWGLGSFCSDDITRKIMFSDGPVIQLLDLLSNLYPEIKNIYNSILQDLKKAESKAFSLGNHSFLSSDLTKLEWSFDNCHIWHNVNAITKLKHDNTTKFYQLGSYKMTLFLIENTYFNKFYKESCISLSVTALEEKGGFYASKQLIELTVHTPSRRRTHIRTLTTSINDMLSEKTTNSLIKFLQNSLDLSILKETVANFAYNEKVYGEVEFRRIYE